MRLRNVGEGGLEIDAVNLGGDAADQYRIARDGCSGRELSPRKSCEIRVRFVPTTHGRHAARLEVASDDPMTPVLTVPLSGRGLRTDVGAIGLEPTRLVFPETETVEVSSERKVKIRNIGYGPLEVRRWALTGSAAADFRVERDDCTGRILKRGKRCEMKLRFAPAVPGQRSAELRIESNDPELPVAVAALSGTAVKAPPGNIRLDADRLVFSPTPVGSDSREVRLSIRNDGPGKLLVRDLRITGAQASEFRIVSDASCRKGALKPGKRCEVKLRFRPASFGMRTAHLEITSSDEDDPVVSVVLEGRGLRTDVGAVAADPAQLRFPDTETIDVSKERKLSLRNAGYGPLVIHSVGLGGDHAADFRIVVDGCSGRTLKRGKRCEVKLRFAPGTAGERTAVLRVDSNDPDVPEFDIPLTGLAIQAPPGNLRVQTLPIEFDPAPIGGESSSRKLKLESLGPGRLVVRSVRMAGDHPADFTVDASACQRGPLKRGKRCELKIRFTPVAAGNRQALLEIETNDAETPVVRVLLRGRALRTDVGAVGIDPAVLEFGDQGPGETSKSRKLRVRNIGYGPLHLDGVGLSGADAGDFRIEKDGCTGRDLERGKRCELTLRFSGSDAGIRSAALDIRSNDPDRPTLSVPLHGRVVPQDIGLDTRNHDFGHVSLGKRSDSRRFRVRNRGLGMLAIDRVALAGEHAAAFVLDSDKCSGRTLKPGKTCEVKVLFRPVTTGDHRAQLTIDSNDPDESRVEIRLSGRGLAE